MELVPFKSLSWNTNECVAKLTVSIISGVSLWDKPCYQNMLNYGSDNKRWKFSTI